jgi:ParB family chromosome partitioning protein
MKEIKIELLEDCAINPRRNYDQTRIDALAESIGDHGVLQPLVVRPIDHGKFEVVAGHCRLRAGRVAGLETLPCLVRNLSDRIVAEIVLAENLQRSDLSPLEEAIGVARLAATGACPDEVAHVCGRSVGWVQLRLDLLGLPEEARDAVDKRRLSIGAAMALRHVPDEKRCDALHQLMLPALLGRPMNVREAEAWVAEAYVDPARRQAAWDAWVAKAKPQAATVVNVVDSGAFLRRGIPRDGFAMADSCVPEHLLVTGFTMPWCVVSAKLGVPVYLVPHFGSDDRPVGVRLVDTGKVREADAARMAAKQEHYFQHHRRQLSEAEPSTPDPEAHPAVEAAEDLIVLMLPIVEAIQAGLEAMAEQLAEDRGSTAPLAGMMQRFDLLASNLVAMADRYGPRPHRVVAPIACGFLDRIRAAI